LAFFWGLFFFWAPFFLFKGVSGFGFFWDGGKKERRRKEYINIIGFSLELLRKKRGWEVWKNAKKENTERKKKKGNKRKKNEQAEPVRFLLR
jgi:hypothetical protein